MKINRLIVLLLISGALTFCSFYGKSSSYGILWFVIGLPVVSGIYTLYIYSKFKIYQTIDKKIVVKGEQVPYKFILSNEDYVSFTNIRVAFSSDVATVKDVDADRIYCLAPHEKIDVETTLSCKYRGEYKAGIKKVFITDWLGIFKVSFPTVTILNMRVLPRVEEINNPELISMDIEAKDASVMPPVKQDNLDIDMRKYVAGDSLKIIHWKASAKKHELMSRKYYDVKKTEAVFVLDLQKVKYEGIKKLAVEDKVLETILSIAKYYVNNRKPFHIIYEQDSINSIVISDKKGFDEFYNCCISLKFNAKRSVSEIIKAMPEYFTSQGFTLIATGNLTEEICSSCSILDNTGAHVSLLNIYDRNEEMNYNLSPRINAINIELEDELSQCLCKA